MTIKDMFEIGGIMEDEDKATSIKVLDDDNCIITGKALNKYKIILHMKRTDDGSEGNVFVRLKDEHSDKFLISKQLFASRKVIGMSLSQFKNFDIEEL
jgi:hypothetical protein